MIKTYFLFFASVVLSSLLSACTPKPSVMTPPSIAMPRDALFSNSILFPSSAVAHFYWPPSDILTRDIRAIGGEIYQSGDFVTLVLPADALFEPGTAVLLPGAQALIVDVAKVIVRFPGEDVIITAHTDGIGAALYQAKLSRQQAQLVALVLWQQERIDLATFNRFKYAGMSDTRPITDDPTAAGQALNRRIQIAIYPASVMTDEKVMLSDQTVEQI